jgi:mevalonate kinase
MQAPDTESLIETDAESVTERNWIQRFAPTASLVGILGLVFVVAANWKMHANLNGELLSAASIANVMVKEENACSFNGESCLETKCCAESGMTCYKKNEGWASCNATCNEKMMWNTSTNKFEEQAEKVWDCTELGNEPDCSKDGENCADTKCCSNQASTCYKKNDHWASCNATCNEKMKYNTETKKFEEQAEKVWDCHKLSCSVNGENCMDSKCCLLPGMTCYKKNEHWASCNATCNEKMMWNTKTNKFEEQAEKVWDCSVLNESTTGS